MAKSISVCQSTYNYRFMKISQILVIGAAVLLGGCMYPESDAENATVAIEAVGNMAAKSVHVEASHSETSGISEKGFCYMLYRGYGGGTDVKRKVCAMDGPFEWDFKVSADFNVQWIRAYIVVDDICVYSNAVQMYDLGIFLN